MPLVVRSFAFVFAALLTTAVPAAAQGPSIDGRLLREGVDTFHVSVAGDVFGRGIIARSRVVTAHGPQLLQVHSWRIAGVAIVDSLFSEVESLRSIRQVRVVGDPVIAVVFRGDSAHVAKRPSTNSNAFRSFALDAGVYSSDALDAIVAGLPLAENFEAQLRFYYAPPSGRGVETISVMVAATDRVKDREGNECDAWVVLAETRGGGTVYWIDKSTRSVLKYDTKEAGALIEFRR